MKKILVVSDSRFISSDLIRFSSLLARESQSPLLGILLNNANIELGAAANYRPSYYDENKTEYGPVMMDTQHARSYFLTECQKEKVEANVLVLNGSPTEELLFESRFADLIILEPELSFLGDADELPSSFVKHILIKSECPVVLAPRSCSAINQLLFCFDGSSSSLYAIKQFTYLFPEYRKYPTNLLEIKESVLETDKKNYKRTIAWMQHHYENYTYQFMEGEVKKDLFAYLLLKENIMVVMGAFGRNMVSNFFNRSTSEYLIRSVDLPLFITHY